MSLQEPNPTDHHPAHDPGHPARRFARLAGAALWSRSPAAQDTALLAMRAMVGVVFTFHGTKKIFGEAGISGFASYLDSIGIPFPTLNAAMAVGTELVGGLALIAGLLVRPAAFALMVTMIVAVVTSTSGFDSRTGGMEYPLTLAVVSLGFVLAGAGRFSLDHFAGRLLTQTGGVARAASPRLAEPNPA